MFCTEAVESLTAVGMARGDSSTATNIDKPVTDPIAKECQKACPTNCGLESLLSEGWKIDTNMPKRFNPDLWTDRHKTIFGDCTCKGTQYVMSKGDSKNDAVLKEIDLLKREVELLK